MSRIKVEIDYRDIHVVSDRTAREILKELSKAIRWAQRSEVARILHAAPINRAQIQSLNDRLDHKIETMPAYYLERLEEGSLRGTVVVTAFAIWLLQNTVGETVKEAWLAYDLHQTIVNYVQNDRPEAFPEFLYDELKDRRLLSGRAEIAGYDVEKDGDDVLIRVNIKTNPQCEIEMDRRIEGDQVIENAPRPPERPRARD